MDCRGARGFVEAWERMAFAGAGQDSSAERQGMRGSPESEAAGGQALALHAARSWRASRSGSGRSFDLYPDGVAHQAREIADFQAFAVHVQSCPQCSRLYGPLVPLLRRDLSIEDGAEKDAGIAGSGSKPDWPDADSIQKLTERTMDRIHTMAVPGRSQAPRVLAMPSGRKEWRSRTAFVAVAAAAVFIAGLALGLRISHAVPELSAGSTIASASGAADTEQTVTVRFVLEAPEATSVRLVGDFDGWTEPGYAMTVSGSPGLWEVSVQLEKGKVYVYNFVLDGETWITDPAVRTRVDDGFGGAGSLLRL